jgi:hypothetical protein
MYQTAAQLAYRLLEGRADLRPLRVLASREIEWCGWSLRLHVLGASHAVELRRGPRCLTELLSCAPAPGAGPALIDLGVSATETGSAAAFGLLCAVRITPFSLDEGDDLAGCFAEDCRLDWAFPPLRNGPARQPITRIGWHAAGLRLTIETVHGYPEEARGVRSLTRFVLEGAEG